MYVSLHMYIYVCVHIYLHYTHTHKRKILRNSLTQFWVLANPKCAEQASRLETREELLQL